MGRWAIALVLVFDNRNSAPDLGSQARGLALLGKGHAGLAPGPGRTTAFKIPLRDGRNRAQLSVGFSISVARTLSASDEDTLLKFRVAKNGERPCVRAHTWDPADWREQ